jgi:predicted HTH domain antitoxin
VTIEVLDRELGLSKLSAADVRLDFAIGLYTGRHLSMGKSARLADISYSAFLQELGRRGISVNYSADVLTHDLKIIETASR